MIEEKVEIDENLYSRQLFTFGRETMGKLMKMRVLIQGLRGIGVETAKNLALAGPNRVSLNDDTACTMPDLGSNFAIKETHVQNGVSRADACVGVLSELNPYVKLDVHKGQIDEKVLDDYDVVVFTECMDRDFLVRMNNYCRKSSPVKGFIWTGTLGLFGYAFLDYGDAHTIFDKNGEELISCVVAGVTKEENATVSTMEDKRHGFEDNDWVTFTEVQGMSQLNDKKFQIQVKSPHTFSIGDTSKLDSYKTGGYVTQVNVPFHKKYKSFEDALADPLPDGVPKHERTLMDPDMDYMRLFKSAELHLYLVAMLDFWAKYGRKPELLNEEDAAAYKQICTDNYAKHKETKMDEEDCFNNITDIDEKLIKNIAHFANCQTAPAASFYGGIICQEIVKYTGKYTPLCQWLVYENFKFNLPEGEVTRKIDNNSRYRDQIVLYGEEFQNALLNAKYFMVGAGALGCELLKLSALMGLCCGENGRLEITDDDTIELSNLNRQFLFRRNHVNKCKSITAAEIAKTMNPNLNIVAHKARASEDNEKLFTDDFWDAQNIIVGAVDNVHARKYVDAKCLLHRKCLFDSGTLGTKCNSQITVPDKTQAYGDSVDQEETGIPMCTIRNYPYMIDHCIEWARGIAFEDVFTAGSSEFANFIKDPNTYVDNKLVDKTLSESSKIDAFKIVSVYLKAYQNNADAQSLVDIARQLFQNQFIDNIAQLLHCFPADYVDKDGRAFWVSPKRPPYVVNFDVNDEMHMVFIQGVVTILKTVFGVKTHNTMDELKEMVQKSQPVVAIMRSVHIKENENDKTEEKGDDDELVLKNLADSLRQASKNTTSKIEATDFEKDDDTNGHIAFIYSTANLRARNYKIVEVDFQRIKFIAGKIIPAIATSTAMIVGVVGQEINKHF